MTNKKNNELQQGIKEQNPAEESAAVLDEATLDAVSGGVYDRSDFETNAQEMKYYRTHTRYGEPIKTNKQFNQNFKPTP